MIKIEDPVCHFLGTAYSNNYKNFHYSKYNDH